jgi:hypothetical protein
MQAHVSIGFLFLISEKPRNYPPWPHNFAIAKVDGSRSVAFGHKTGGRQAGTPNKRTLDVVERIAALGCDPIAGMARIAMDSTTPVDVRARMFAELAGYVAPKRRAIEHSAEGGSEFSITWSMPDANGLPTQG